MTDAADPPDLSLAESMVLLTLDETTGRAVGRAGMAPDLALAGAMLMDLARAGRVDTDRDRLWVTDDAPTWDPVLDAALGHLAAPGAPGDARGAILLLARDIADPRDALLDRLVAAGALGRFEDKVLWLFTGRQHPAAAGQGPADLARARLRGLLLDQEIPPPRDALLLGLVRAAGLLPLILDAGEAEQVQPWLALVTRIERLNRSLGAAVAALRGADAAG